MSVTSIHAFAEKVVLITDGTNSVGRAVAMQLALNGAFVIVGIPGAKVDGAELIEDLAELGTLVKTCNWDPFDQNGAAKFIASAASFFGRIDLLVNSIQIKAGEMGHRRFEDSLWAIFSITKYAWKVMEERPKPRIVSVIANESDSENFAGVARSIIEHGMIGMTRSLVDVLPKKFRVNAVRVCNRSLEAGVVDKDSSLTGQQVASDDVARTVLFLLSGEAVAVNGQVIDVTQK